jgi:hypothetical protein
MYGDFPFARGWVFTPSIGAAIYLEHNGLHLGYPLEFRTAVELTHGLGATRFGAAFGHYSNFYMGETNRGTEYLKAVLIVPLSRRTGS